MVGQNNNSVPPLENVVTPDVSNVNLPNTQANLQTGLTTTEEALLSPSEKIIQQKRKGMVNANTA